MRLTRLDIVEACKDYFDDINTNTEEMDTGTAKQYRYEAVSEFEELLTDYLNRICGDNIKVRRNPDKCDFDFLIDVVLPDGEEVTLTCDVKCLNSDRLRTIQDRAKWVKKSGKYAGMVNLSQYYPEYEMFEYPDIVVNVSPYGLFCGVNVWEASEDSELNPSVNEDRYTTQQCWYAISSEVFEDYAFDIDLFPVEVVRVAEAKARVV